MRLPPARIGDAIGTVETPALIIDLDVLEANLSGLAVYARDVGVRLRPHAKTHKSPLIAAKQIALGAVGQCCQKVSEAEILVAGGVGDVLVTNEVWGASKLNRLAALARHARIGVCVDDKAAIAAMSAAADQFGSTLHVLVEIDVGANRCGVQPGEAAAVLAAEVAASKGLRFDGLQAYHGGAQHKRRPAERREAIAGAARGVEATLNALAAKGLAARTVGGAGTGTFALEASSGLWNELQAGSYIFLDADYAQNTLDLANDVPRFAHALFVLATVMSRTERTRAVLDAGHKALGNDSGFPVVQDKPGWTYHRPADEHGILAIPEADAGPELGEKLLLVPGHCDPTINLYDWYVGVRGLKSGSGYVEALWPVAARGAIT